MTTFTLVNLAESLSLTVLETVALPATVSCIAKKLAISEASVCSYATEIPDFGDEIKRVCAVASAAL